MIHRSKVNTGYHMIDELTTRLTFIEQIHRSLLFVMPEVLSRASMALKVDSRLRNAGMTAQTTSIPNLG